MSVSRKEYERAADLFDAYEEVSEGLKKALTAFEALDESYDVDDELCCIEDAMDIVCRKMEDAESVMATFDREEMEELKRDSYRW